MGGMSETDGQAEEATARGADVKVAFYLFVGALALHVFFLLQYAESPFCWAPRLDDLFHDIMARQILEGKLPAEPYFRAPAYGYLLALWYQVFGVQNFLLARIAQGVLGSVAVVLLYATGCRVFSNRVGLLAGVTMALYGPLVFHISDLHTTVIEVFCACLVARLYSEAYLRRGEGRPVLPWAFAAGVVLGLWATARPNGLIAIPAGMLFLLGRPPRRPGVLSAGVFLAGSLLLPLVFTARNAVVGKEPTFIAWFGGINFSLASRAEADGILPAAPARYQARSEYEEVVALYARASAEQAMGRRVTFAEMDRYWYGQAFAYWRDSPLAMMTLTGKRLLLVLGAREVRNIVGYDYIRAEWTPALWFAFVGFWYAGPFGLVGMVLAWNRARDSRPLAVMALCYLFSFALFFAADRYRLPAVPLLLLFAAYAVTELWDRFRADDRQSLVAPLVGLVALLVVTCVEWVPTQTPASWAKDVWSAGNRYNALKKYAEGEKQHRRAVALDPANADFWSGLGESLYYQGRFAEAADAFRQGISRAVFTADLTYNLALCQKEMGQTPEARATLEALLREHPDHRAARELLAELSPRR
jgi:4-amino-4-deoxy-L-arabinose transferase-like glycosyltransferase